MIKSFFAATALLVATASTAAAGPFVNLERNDGFVAADDSEINGWGGAATELHLGYEGQLGPMPFYIQGGPAYLQGSGVESETELSGKVGGSFQITDDLGAYWEASFLTGDDTLGYASKLGAKWSF